MRANVPTTISSSPAGKQRNHEVGSSNRSQCASVDGVGWWKERARNCSLRAKKHPSRLEGAVSKSRLLQKIGIPVFSPRRRQEGVRDTEVVWPSRQVRQNARGLAGRPWQTCPTIALQSASSPGDPSVVQNSSLTRPDSGQFGEGVTPEEQLK